MINDVLSKSYCCTFWGICDIQALYDIKKCGEENQPVLMWRAPAAFSDCNSQSDLLQALHDIMPIMLFAPMAVKYRIVLTAFESDPRSLNAM